jgi:hypothetical protein
VFLLGRFVEEFTIPVCFFAALEDLAVRHTLLSRDSKFVKDIDTRTLNIYGFSTGVWLNSERWLAFVN